MAALGAICGEKVGSHFVSFGPSSIALRTEQTQSVKANGSRPKEESGRQSRSLYWNR
jgi:hypothetical protein